METKPTVEERIKKAKKIGVLGGIGIGIALSLAFYLIFEKY